MEIITYAYLCQVFGNPEAVDMGSYRGYNRLRQGITECKGHEEMTDNDYAARIYCQVFKMATDNGDAYTRGILDALSSLNDREQSALECYYRYGRNYRRTAQSLGGMTGETARRTVKRAISKLRRPSLSCKMSVAGIVESKEKLLENAENKINELYDQIDRASQSCPIDLDIQVELNTRKTSVCDIGLPARAHKALWDSGIHTVESLLSLDSLDAIAEKRGFGQKSLHGIISVMRGLGHNEWADHMEAERS